MSGLSVGRYLLGSAALLAVVGLGVWNGLVLRRLTLGRWTGAPARLVEAVWGLGTLLWTAQVMGAAGRLRLGPYLLALTGVTGALTLIALRRPPPATASPTPEPTDEPAAPRWHVQVAFVAAGAIFAQTLGYVIIQSAVGVIEVDSLNYHLPFAARFAQEGSLTELHHVSPFPWHAFHAANAELLQGIAILPYGRDLLAPWLNLGWLLLLLLAGWCVGLRFGLGAVSLLGTTAVAAVPILRAQAGAGNDLAVYALIGSALAIVILGSGSFSSIAVGAVAAGLAAGTKASAVVPVALLALVVMAVAHRRRGRALLTWVGVALVAGGFWYLRNLIRTGNPVPAVRLSLGPLELPTPATEFPNAHTVAEFVGDGEIWRELFLPGIGTALGWPFFVLAPALVAVITIALVRGPGPARALAVATVGSTVGYLLTPSSASGVPGSADQTILFVANTRYGIPALLLSVWTLPVLLRRRSARAVGAVIVALALFQAVNQVLPNDHVKAFPVRHILMGAALTATAILVVGLAWRWRARFDRRWAGGLVSLLLILGVAGGWLVQRRYFARRYVADGGVLLQPVYDWVADVRDARIGIVGFDLQYPLYGSDLSNHVQYVGRTGPHGEFTDIRDCATLARTLSREHYDYLVTGPSHGRPFEPAAAGWARRLDGATEVMHRHDLSFFRLNGRLDPTDCQDSPPG